MVSIYTRSLYVCILNKQGETLLHKEIPASPEPLLSLIEPFLDDLVIGVECMHCWYWVADFCEDQGLPFILGNVSSREQLKHTFDDPMAQRNIDMDMAVLDCYQRELKKVEWLLEKQAKQDKPITYHLLQTIPGIGRILALTILYEIGDIERFESVQKFASYSRLIKCKAESAGKTYGTQGNKIGNAHLKWAFSEAAVLYLRANPGAQQLLQRFQKRMSKAKALSALAHKLGP